MERIKLHLTLTSPPWTNLVERFFRDLTVDCVRDGSFVSIKELADVMEAFMQQRDLGALHLQEQGIPFAGLEFRLGSRPVWAQKIRRGPTKPRRIKNGRAASNHETAAQRL